MRSRLLRPNFLCFCGLFAIIAGCGPASIPEKSRPPNILLVITDDQSWEHLGVYGDKAISTPNIDRLAVDGVRFLNAYTGSPSCTPSRAAILTGQQIYRLQEGGVLWGFIREQYDVFPKLLEDSGFFVGNTGKAFAPTPRDTPGAHEFPLGLPYNNHTMETPDGISNKDYSANFDEFLSQVPGDKPFFFWLGFSEPHIPYPTGLGAEEIDVARIRVPAYLPDAPEVRSSLADYLFEIEWADEVLGHVLASLAEADQLDNTVIIFTSDNGMPFPRAKATLYDAGVRMPLIVTWGERLQGNRSINHAVSLTDLAPTILEIAGLEVPTEMTGKSLRPLLLPEDATQDRLDRDFVVSAIEKHVGVTRPNKLGYPRRAIHTEDWTLIRNYEPDRWPAGNGDIFVPNWDFYGDIDPTPAKAYMMEHQDEPGVKDIFPLSFGKAPEYELYDKRHDPDMVENLAYDSDHKQQFSLLRKKLDDYLLETDDPRSRGESPWDAIDLDR